MLRKKEIGGTAIALLLCGALLLTGCQGVRRQDLSGLNAALVQQSKDLSQDTAVGGGTLTLDENHDLELLYLEVPEDLQPIGLIDSSNGYMLDDEKKNLLRYSFDSRERTSLVSLESFHRVFGPEIAFTQRWLVWVEIGELEEAPDGSLQRQCWLMAQRIDRGDSPVMQIDAGTVTAIEGVFLPFDSLTLDKSHLVYRRSTFSNGWRDTEVRLVDLDSGIGQTLYGATGSGGRLIAGCHISNDLIVWDVQIMQETTLEGLPPQQSILYDLYSYQLDGAKLRPGEGPLLQISMNRAYYAPYVYKDWIFALEQRPIMAQSITMLNHIVMINTLILSKKRVIHEGVEFYRAKQQNVGRNLDRFMLGLEIEEEQKLGLMDLFELNGTPRSICFFEPSVTKRYLSWSSNVSDRQVVYDLERFGLIELPLFFQGSTSEPPQYTSHKLPALDADCLLFEALEGGERYILCLQ